MDKTHHETVIAPFPEEILKCPLNYFVANNGCVLSNQSFLFLVLLI